MTTQDSPGTTLDATLTAPEPTRVADLALRPGDLDRGEQAERDIEVL